MAKAIIEGREYEVRSQQVNESVHSVAVLDQQKVTRATTTLGSRKPVLFRFKLHAKSREAAIRQALKLLKEAGDIDDFVLEPGEEPPPPPEPKAKVAPAPEKAEADAEPDADAE
jgi:hypothetical protein